MQLFAGPVDDAAMDLAVSNALVRRASSGEVTDAIRIYRPAGPVLVFGRRDTRHPGFQAAVQAGRDAGFQPLVRAVGGRPVAYTSEAIVVDHVRHDLRATEDHQRRFASFGIQYAEALRALGVDARVGEVPGEYCPGAQSINARGAVKLVGTAQRVVQHAWLFSSLTVIGDDDRIRSLLVKVYAHLELPLDPATVGSLTTERPDLTATTVEQHFHAVFAPDVTPSALDQPTLELAASYAPDHRV
ncbi:lipoate--protein ligase [Kribbella sp. ALI-6-A]|uniref:lipoate--protein ligase family protein n=1 Tax=Kribbella sp. ALI-6-A TaxID=1933817 RepID=UPI00097C01D3|nr:lipoate--protein ligase [Kribbella sp. ALI-6-A]ONI74030.1 lipoate--protein ligase [Kribbella sp. ALI-6-A]